MSWGWKVLQYAISIAVKLGIAVIREPVKTNVTFSERKGGLQQYRLFEFRKKFVLFRSQKKEPIWNPSNQFFSKLDVGNVLSSQEVALQVFSPLQVFTTVFGMGTGGLPAIGHQQTCRLLLPIILGFSYTLKIA